MSNNTKVLHEKRLKAIADARTILEAAKRDGNRAIEFRRSDAL